MQTNLSQKAEMIDCLGTEMDEGMSCERTQETFWGQWKGSSTRL